MGEKCLQRLNGIFAFAIWDSKLNRLFCARDRLGVKPFYYFRTPHRLIFCSEIKGILAVLTERPTLNDRLVYDYLTTNLLDHTEETFFSGVKRLPAGTYLFAEKGYLKILPYWRIPDELSFSGNFEENAASFYDLFRDAVRLQMRADVPVGCCLSGGLDSSSVAAIASTFTSHPMKVFTARFRDKGMDEWAYAQEIHLSKNVEPFSIFANPEDFWRELYNVIDTQEEPFGGPGVFVQWQLMKLVGNENIRVVLDGQGGDELLCGYAKYFYLALFELLRAHQVFSIFHTLLDATLHGGKQLFDTGAARRYVSSRFGLQKQQTRLLNDEFAASLIGGERICSREGVHQQQLLDITRFSLPVLLRYEDKNSMAQSIESRVPFLDHRLVEFTTALPTINKIRHGESKVILRHALRSEVPQRILSRRSKLGFGGTYVSWVRSLKPSIKAWLAKSTRPVDRFVSKQELARLVDKHDFTIFLPIILDAWMENFGMS